MNPEKMAAIMAVIVPDVVSLICERQDEGELEALRAFIESRTYAVLEDEETKVWHFSAETLYAMFAGERETGYVAFPEEA